MYSPTSPVLSSLDRATSSTSSSQRNGTNNLNLHNHHHHHFQASIGTATGGQCLKFKYFTTFLVSTTCLALLSASLATHKWIVSKPIRVLRLSGGLQLGTSANNASEQQQALLSTLLQFDGSSDSSIAPGGVAIQPSSGQPTALNGAGGSNNKFQGEIYFGLFRGIKVLNHGFGDRISQFSVLQAFATKEGQQELVNFKLWLLTLSSVLLAILFALIGSIFAIINFVITPIGTLTGPVGLVIWNATACFSSLLAIITWLIEYFIRLQANVLTIEEVQNGWTSENRSQFGYSYYFVVLAFVLHLVNIFIVSIVQFETWTNNKANKRQPRASACEGVIMLY